MLLSELKNVFVLILDKIRAYTGLFSLASGLSAKLRYFSSGWSLIFNRQKKGVKLLCYLLVRKQILLCHKMSYSSFN